MPPETDSPFAYCVLRLVPDVERAEFLNAAVVVFARQAGFLGARTGLDVARLHAIAPGCDPAPIARHLAALDLIVAGAREAGPIAALDPSERFNWIAAPSSTLIQPSPVHTGVTGDPGAMLDHLFERLVVV